VAEFLKISLEYYHVQVDIDVSAVEQTVQFKI